VTRRLLLADDSVTIQRVVELTFSGEDIEVVTVSDGEEAIASMTADPPDIILADIAMPKKNGYEVAAFVKEHPTLSRVPVLLLAGAFEPVDEERAKRVKCDGVLVKPFETHEVITRVRELIDGNRQDGPPEPVTPPAPPPAPPHRAEVIEMPQAARSIARRLLRSSGRRVCDARADAAAPVSAFERARSRASRRSRDAHAAG
jgi:CheY-like chemotaxis protein